MANAWKHVRLLAGLQALLCAAPMAQASPDALDRFLRKPEVANIVVSPGGDYLAWLVPEDDRTVLAIQRRADGKWTSKLDAGERVFFDGVVWTGNERLLAYWSARSRFVAQPVSMRSLYGVDVDGKNRRIFHGAVIDPLLHSPGRVLIVECQRETRRGCHTRLREVGDVDRDKPEEVVDGPIPEATFLTDRMGDPWFSWATDEDRQQQVFVRRDGQWVSMNDERASGVTVTPLGISHDRKTAYLWSQRREGPDVVETMDLATGVRARLSEDPSGDPLQLVWSFDGNDLIGVRYGEGRPRTEYVAPDHPHAALLRELEREFPGERTTVTSASRDGSVVVVRVDGDREPGRFYLLDVASGEMTLVARKHRGIDAAGLSPMRPVDIPIRDGGTLTGYLTLPVSAGGDVPLVVLVHGGPFGIRDTWRFDEEVQMLAAHGYAVLQANFRGSGGRGLAFEKSGYRQWGGRMLEDIADATRWAASQPGVDRRRACIWGGSYGAYAALMSVVREPSLFRCAIGLNGPYDLPTLHKWGDVQRSEQGRKWLDLSVGSDVATLRADSPTWNADRIGAAVFIAQGGRDSRVSPEHFRAMTRALDKAGKRYEAYFPSSETHGFHDAKSRKEYYSRVFAFLSRHLAALPADP